MEVLLESIDVLVSVLPKTLIGMIAGSVLISSPFFRNLAEILAKILKIRSSIAVISFFANKATPLLILSQMHRRGIVDERDVLIASVAGLFPMALRSVTLTLAPVADS